MSDVDNYLCVWWKPIDFGYDGTPSYSYLEIFWSWRNPQKTRMGTSFWREESLRKISDVIPQFAQCILIVLMALERYIIICHATAATRILTPKIRKILYSITTTSLTAFSVFVFIAYRQEFPHLSDSIKNHRQIPEPLLEVTHLLSGPESGSEFDSSVKFTLLIVTISTMLELVPRLKIVLSEVEYSSLSS